MRLALSSAMVSLRQMAVARFAYAALIGQPLLIATLAMFMLRHQTGFEAVYVVVGTALTGLWSNVLLFGNAINIDRFAGRLEYIVAAPASMFVIVAGRAVSTLVFSLAAGLIGYVVAAWLFGYSLSVREPLPFAISAGLTVLSVWSLGMLLAPLTFRWIGISNFIGGLEYPLYIFGGFLFPVTLLTDWLRPIAYTLPPYWGARALHATSSGVEDISSIGLYWLLLLLTSAVCLLLAWWLTERFIAWSRRHGRVGMV